MSLASYETSFGIDVAGHLSCCCCCCCRGCPVQKFCSATCSESEQPKAAHEARHVTLPAPTHFFVADSKSLVRRSRCSRVLDDKEAVWVLVLMAEGLGQGRSHARMQKRGYQQDYHK